MPFNAGDAGLDPAVSQTPTPTVPTDNRPLFEVTEDNAEEAAEAIGDVIRGVGAGSIVAIGTAIGTAFGGVGAPVGAAIGGVVAGIVELIAIFARKNKGARRVEFMSHYDRIKYLADNGANPTSADFLEWNGLGEYPNRAGLAILRTIDQGAWLSVVADMPGEAWLLHTLLGWDYPTVSDGIPYWLEMNPAGGKLWGDFIIRVNNNANSDEQGDDEQDSKASSGKVKALIAIVGAFLASRLLGF